MIDTRFGEYARLALVANETHLFWATTEQNYGDAGIEYRAKRDGSSVSRIALGNAQVSHMVVDGDRLVIGTWEGTLLSCIASDCDNTLQRTQLTAPPGEAAFTGTVEQLAFDEEYYYLLNEGRILRVIKNGSSAFEIIAKDVGPLGQLVVHGDSVYWSQRLPAGVFACPKTGCLTDPMLVIGSLHDPNALIVEDDFIYVSEPIEFTANYPHFVGEGVPGSDRLLRCPIAGCSEPAQLRGGYAVLGPMAIDGASLYYLRFQGDACATNEKVEGIGFVAKATEVSP